MNTTCNLIDRLDAAIEVARLVGTKLEAADLSRRDENIKGHNDIVTIYDKLAEHTIITSLHEKFPDDTFFGEEGGSVEFEQHDEKLSSGRWIIDPIDGTANFTRGIKEYAVSIAFEFEKNSPVLGVVYAPKRNELFTAVKGQGAFLNNNKIQVSDISDPAHAMTIFAFPFRRHDLYASFLQYLHQIFQQTHDLRDFGSAALHLCFVASGKAEAFVEYDLGYYDIAAGMVILQEAGGSISSYDPSIPVAEKCDVIATNSLLHDWYVSTVRNNLLIAHS